MCKKSAVNLILNETSHQPNQIISYKKGLQFLELEPLYIRRTQSCLNFSLNCLKDKELCKMFPLKKKIHNMQTRNPEKIQNLKPNHERLKKSALPYMRALLNNHFNKKE